MNFSVEVITKDKIQTSIWSGGKTNEIYIYPRKSSYKDMDFKWRISSATVEAEHSVFTNLPGVTRYITTLNGKLKISHNDDRPVEIGPYEIHQFSGDDKTESYGRVIDFNLMLKDDAEGLLKAFDVSHEKVLIAEAEQYKNLCIYTYEDDIKVYIDDQTLRLKKGQAVVISGNNLSDVPEISAASMSKVKIVAAQIK